MGNTAQASRWEEILAGWRPLLRGIPEYAAVIGVQGVVHAVNRPWPGVECAAGEGSGFFDWIAADDHDQARDAAIRALAAGQTTACTVRLAQSDGTARRMMIRLTPVEAEAPGSLLLALGTEVQAGDEEPIWESKDGFRAVFDNVADAVFIHDPDSGRILDVNAAVCDLYGYTREEAVALTVGDLSANKPPFTQEAAIGRVRRAVEEGPQVFDWLARHSDGRLFWTQVSLKRAAIAGTNRILAIVRDITDNKEAEQALRESERRLATLMANLPGMAYRCANDPEWTMEFVSDGYLALTGYDPSDLLGNAKLPFAGLIHRQDRQAVWDMVQEALEARHPFQLIYRIQKKSREVRWVWEQGMGVFSDEGELLALEGFIIDITDRQNAEVALRESEERFRRLAGATSQGVVIHDRGIVLDVNERAAEIWGYDADEMIGMNVLDLAAPASAGLVRSKVSEGDEKAYTGMAQRKDGSQFPAEVVGRSIPYQGGTARVAAVYDITAFQRAEEEIRTRVEAERLLLRELDHRVRNNLAALSALIRLVAASSTDVTRFAEAIGTRVQAMAAVHGLLSSIRWQPVQLRTLIEAQLPPGCAGSLLIEGESVPVVASQAQALGMLVNELMANSLKHGALGVAGGRVQISWNAAASADGGVDVELTWTEAGGPEVTPDPVSGVGTSLMAGLVKSELLGRAAFDYPPEGARHNFVFHLEPQSAQPEPGTSDASD